MLETTLNAYKNSYVTSNYIRAEEEGHVDPVAGTEKSTKANNSIKRNHSSAPHSWLGRRLKLLFGRKAKRNDRV